ncbi:MAG: AAA family ATPase [Candidatus Thorarchaeota archaeon]
MKILRLELTNFKPFRRLELPPEGELPDGLILIRGPNSTGKSSIFEAILWALWGANAVALKNEDLINTNSTFCKVVLEFAVAGTTYKIERSYDPANQTRVILYRLVDDHWRRIADKTRTVAREIEQILNLQLDQALNTLLVRQGEVARIALAPPSELRELLERVYNIKILEDMSRHLGNLEDDLSIRIKTLRDEYTRPEVLEEQLAQTQARVTELEAEASEKQEELKTRREAFDRLPDPALIDQLDRLLQRISEIERDIERIKREKERDLKEAGLPVSASEAIAKRQKVLRKQVERIDKEISALTTQVAEIDQEIGAIGGREKDLRKKIQALRAVSADSEGVARCPTCSKPLTAEERDSIVAEYESEIESGKQRLSEITKQRKSAESRIRELRDRLSQTESALQAVNRAASRDNELQQVMESLESAKSGLESTLREAGVKDIASLLETYGAKELSGLKTRHGVLKEQIRALENRLAQIDREIGRARAEIAAVEKRIEKMRQIGAEIQEMESIRDHTKYVRLNLVRGFVADWVFQKRLIGIIRTATKQYVTEFTNGQYTQIDLIPTPPRGRSGPGLALSIRDERDNVTKTKEKISFGDRTAISLALRLGISRTMSSIRPLKDSPALSPRVRCVLLDEPLGGLDRQRRLSVVANLVNDKSFQQILLITHTDIQSWQGVPVIDVQKTDGGSTAVLRLSDES